MKEISNQEERRGEKTKFNTEIIKSNRDNNNRRIW